jgi:hypothetical protein
MTYREMPRRERCLAAVLGLQFAVFSFFTLAAGPRPATAQEVEEDPETEQTSQPPATEETDEPPAIQETDEAPAAEETEQDPVERAHASLVTGEYGKAEAVLRTAVNNETDPAILWPIWLKLIQTHVVHANSYGAEDVEIAEHYLRTAKETIRECLENRELADLRPDPDLFHHTMIELFDETAREMFGLFVVKELNPANAIVRLDGTPVLIPPGEDLPRAENVPVGKRVITAEASGYQTATEEITINPNGTYSHTVNLKKKRGIIWYAGRGAVIAGAAVVAILVGGGGGGQTAEEPLPGPPGPPN